MKKVKSIIIFWLVFAILSSAAVIYADSYSLAGRKVQGDAIVTLNGHAIGNAIIIDGVSYAPVRVVAEASGLTAGFKKGEIVLKSSEAINGVTTSEKITDGVDIDALTKEKRRLEIEVSTLQNYVKDADQVITFYTDSLKRVDESLVESYEESLSKAEDEKKIYQDKLRAAESRISEIDKLLNI